MNSDLFYVTDEFGNIIAEKMTADEAGEKISELNKAFPDEKYYINNELK